MSAGNLNRRRFLAQGAVAGGLLALPQFASYGAGDGDSPASRNAAKGIAPRRLVVLHNPLSFYNPAFYPDQEGLVFDAPRLLKPLEFLRGKYTVFKGLDHPDCEGGHTITSTLLTGINYEHRPNKRQSVSLDQMLADKVGIETRFDKLVIGGTPISYDVNGTPCPDYISQARDLYRLLFVTDQAEQKQWEQRIARNKSIIDSVHAEAGKLSRQLNGDDRQRLDHYLTAIRDLEQRMAKQVKWSRVDKPTPPEGMNEPVPSGIMHTELRNEFDLAVLALQTDSTRVITMAFGVGGAPTIPGLSLTYSYHELSHHGMEPERIEQLVGIEEAHMLEVARFLKTLSTTTDANGQPLLDSTIVLISSGMGNSHSHSNQQLPVLVVGGGYKHRGFVDLSDRDIPLCNLFVDFAQRTGVDCEAFGSSNGQFTELS